MKFAANGTLYRGSKPVMWSVVEKTALAEAEVEYEDYTSGYGLGEVSGSWERWRIPSNRNRRNSEEATTLRDAMADASVVIWTTTPWTIPGNRAIAYSAEDCSTSC